MRTNGIKISYDSVNHYLNLMIKFYFFYECKRFDVKGKDVVYIQVTKLLINSNTRSLESRVFNYIDDNHERQ